MSMKKQSESGQMRRKFDSVLTKLYIIFAAFVLLCFGVYFIKLVIHPEGTLPWAAVITVLCAVIIPFFFRRSLRCVLRAAYIPIKAVMCAGMAFFTVTFIMLVGYIYLFQASGNSIYANADVENVYIVFGAKIHEWGPSQVLAARLNSAAEVMKEDSGAICITSGGQGADEPTSEGECMRDYMINKGISEDRIFAETESYDTLSNIKNSVKLLEELGESDRQIVCVSSDTHIPRIRLMCSRAGVDAEYIKAPSPKWELIFPTLVREYMSYAKMLIMGH